MSKTSTPKPARTPSKAMTRKAASRIQSHTDKTGRNQGFKQRAQRAGHRHESTKK